MRTLAIVLLPLAAQAADGPPPGAPAPAASTCGDFKEAYRQEECCGTPSKLTHFQVVPMPAVTMFQNNYCAGKKPIDALAEGDGYFNNIPCRTSEGIVQALEQAGTNVTAGYTGSLAGSSDRTPISVPYYQAGLCPVNVHWHLGTEHLSSGQYDENGMGPTYRRLADGHTRRGFRCHHYNPADTKFTTEYNWKHCVGMHVGETYEVHWPHSAAGACNTPYQFQSPFYDGVFCNDGVVSLDPLKVHEKVGVQAQVFTIVNDEAYYYPDLMRGMLSDGDYGYSGDMAYYTGSTTGPTRSNEVCSRYTPITWQVDRKCHLISASSFDKMCADMKAQVDDMSGDLHAHGARELVADELASNDNQR